MRLKTLPPPLLPFPFLICERRRATASDALWVRDEQAQWAGRGRGALGRADEVLLRFFMLSTFVPFCRGCKMESARTSSSFSSSFIPFFPLSLHFLHSSFPILFQVPAARTYVVVAFISLSLPVRFSAAAGGQSPKEKGGGGGRRNIWLLYSSFFVPSLPPCLPVAPQHLHLPSPFLPCGSGIHP